MYDEDEHSHSEIQLTNDNIHDCIYYYVRERNNARDRRFPEGPIGQWDVKQVTDMRDLFWRVPEFNENIEDWDVSNVTDMAGMFKNCEEFNQPLHKWNVSKVTDMDSMFLGCISFNQSLNGWDVSNVTNMTKMFAFAEQFNSPLDQWNVSNVKSMYCMFQSCDSLKQSFATWNINPSCNTTLMFDKTPMTNELLPSGVSLLPSGVSLSTSTSSRPDLLTTPAAPATRATSSVNAVPTTSVSQPTATQINNAPTIGIFYKRTPLTSSSAVVNVSSDVGSDVINMTESTVLQQLQTEPSTVVFYFNNKPFFATNDTLQYLLTTRDQVATNIKFECKQTNTMRRENIVADVPYFSMRSLGMFGVVPLSQINEVLHNDRVKMVEMVPTDKQLASTISLQMLGLNPNMVGASHCQEGQGETVYELKQINASIEGGKRNKRRTKKRKRRTQKRTRMSKSRKVKKTKSKK